MYADIAEMVKVVPVLNLGAVFKTVHDHIMQNGKVLKLVDGPENTDIESVHEIEKMLAITYRDGSLELGVRSMGRVACGHFPRMDKEGGLSECRSNWQNNLAVYQARLKL